MVGSTIRAAPRRATSPGTSILTMRLPERAGLSAGLLLTLCAPPAAAQQFVHQTGLLPGTPRWSEGVEAVDVDQDGDLDLLFADGDGFSSAGTQRQNVLLINQLVETGVLAFTDESVTRLGVNESNAKGVTAADVDGDGWVDLLFSNAFFTDPPSLYMNRGAVAPGFFTLESASRGLTTPLSSGGAMFGDVDDDGDLDLVINGTYLGSGSGKPRLYLNDGAGFFTEAAAALNAPNKSAHMDVHLVDIDGDWDVDFFGPNRAVNAGGNHYLMLNQGDGTFADSSALLPGTSGSVYEAEVGDLDGDQDMDLFFVSLAGFSEGAMRNDLVPSGSLGFTSQGSFGGDDDNEIVLLDHDVDGDLDVIVGKLGSGGEKLYRNDGGFAFVLQAGAFTSLTDSTLDATAADLDNDGRYDVITAQGESGVFTNKVYLNNGPVDTLAPVVVAVNAPATAPANGPFVVKAKVRDQVLDDGVDHVRGLARYVVVTAPQTFQVDITAGGFSPAFQSVPAGATVRWTNTTAASHTVTSTTAPYGFDLTLAPGASYERAFVAPILYAYTDTLGGANGQIDVTGSAASAPSLRAGVQQHRFGMADTAGGQGVEAVYELEFADWPGNVTVTEPGVIALGPACTVSAYCTAKVSSNLCLPQVGWSGTPSASGGSFLITASAVEANQLGVLFYGTSGPAAQPFQGGFLCVQAPVTRLVPQASGGAAVCTGAYSVDFGAHIQSGLDPALAPGAQAWLQFWFRDPGAATGTGLTNAATATICP